MTGVQRTNRSAALRRVVLLLVFAAAASVAGGSQAYAGSPPYTIEGGNAREQTQVRAALEASDFDWSVLPRQIAVRISRGGASCGSPGQVYLDANLLDARRFSWGVVQHEFAHQVDFLLLDDSDRQLLQRSLGGVSWWGRDGLPHEALTSERFASALAWAYWPVRDNVMQPLSAADEAGGMEPAAFRSVLTALLMPKQIQRVSSR